MKRNRALALLVVFVFCVTYLLGDSIAMAFTEPESGMREASPPGPVTQTESEALEESENPDHLDQPTESPAAVAIPLVSGTPRDTTGKGMRSLAGPMANGDPVIGVDHPTQPGEVMTFKEAKAVPGMVNTWDITLRVEGKDEQKTSDIVLVIDRSGSMNDGAKMANAKAAANLFVDRVLDESLNTRIAVVSFAGDVRLDIDFTNDKTALHNAINGLNANGGTYTQGGVRSANELLAGSDATMKNIVLLSDGQPTYSTRLYDPDAYLISYPGNGWQTSTEAPASAYDYSSRVGDGTYLYYRYENNFGVSNDKYYNHGNSAIAEAGFAKSAGYTLYTIALDAGPTGTAILNQMASPGKAYQTSDPAALTPIFNEIAGELIVSVRDAQATDLMGMGFNVIGDVTDITASQGIPTLNDGRIDWDIGSLTMTDPAIGDPTVKYAQLTYRVEINDGILDATPEGDLYKTNQEASITYKDGEGTTQTVNFPEPQVDPILLVVEKVLKDSSGNVIADPNRTFNINVRNQISDESDPHYYSKNYRLKGGERKILTNLRLEDTYTVTEVATDTSPPFVAADYDTTINVYGEDQSTFQIRQGNPDSPVLVTNQEKPLGKLTIYKLFNPGDNPIEVTDPAGNDLNFDFTVTGPNGYLNDSIQLKIGESITLPDLAYGEYTVTETSNNGFVPSYNPADGKVALTITEKEKSVTVTNRPDPNDQNVDVTATKIWMGGSEESHVAIPLTLYANGMEVVPAPAPTITPPTGTSDTFTYVWTGLPKYGTNGLPITYTVDEKIVPPQYVKSLSEDKLTVTNTFTPEAGKTVTANKVWQGGPSDRPDVWFKLYRNIEDGPVEEVPAAEAPIKHLPNGTFDATWTDLLKEDINANPYYYSVREVDASGADFVPEGYEKTENGLTVTNKYKIPTGTVAAKKVWVNGPADHPDVWFKLYRNIENGPVTAVPDISVLQLPDGDGNEFTVEWNDIEQTDVNGNPYTFTVMEVDVNGEPFTPENYVKEESGLTVTNTYQPPLLEKVIANKVWVGGSAQTRETIGFELHRKTDLPGDEGAAVPGATIKPLPSGVTQVEWNDLRETDEFGNQYTYYVKEMVHEGEPAPGEEPVWVYGAPAGYEMLEDGLTVTNTYQVPVADPIKAKKVWHNGPAEKPSVWFKLYRNIPGEEPQEVPVSEAPIKHLPDGTTEVEWTGLPKTDGEANPYSYSVKEVDESGNDFVPEEYSKVELGLTVSNLYTAPKGDITAEKTWVNGPAEKPSVWFKLYRSVGSEDPIEVQETPWLEIPDGETSVTWANLPLKDDAGNTYTYSVQEVDENGEPFVPENYGATGEGTLNITNTYQIPLTEVEGKKIWKGGPAERPTIWLQLYRNVEGEEPAIVPDADIMELASGTESVKWEGVESTTSEGVAYIFSVREVDADGNDFTPTNYTKVEEGLTVTNTYQIPLIDVEGEKTWVGGPAEKPTIWLQLYRNVEGEEPAIVPDADIMELASGTESVKWEGVESTTSEGVAYIFSVREVDADGNDFTPEEYTKSEDGHTVTNTYTPPTGDITAEKAWVDGPAEKPSVWFKLYRNIEGQEPVEVEGASLVEITGSNTTASWLNLPLKDGEGNAYTYGVREVDENGEPFVPENYEATGEGTLKITNTYQIPLIDVTGEKTWVGGPAEKPTIWLQLYRNVEGEEPAIVPDADIMELASGTESVKWEDVESTTSEGVAYIFSVREVDADGNDLILDDYVKAEEGLEVTNTYIEPTSIDPPVQKLISGDKPGADATFSFKMKALDGAPFYDDAVGGEKTIDIIGAGSEEFGEIEMGRGGTFVYEISEINTGDTGYTYDTNVYTLTAVITKNRDAGEYQKEVTIVDGEGNAVESITFTNEYKTPKKPEPTKPDPTKKLPPGQKKPIKTGDAGVPLIAVILLLLSAMAIRETQRMRGRK
jgi:pilin isopeptide linkage protein